MSRYRVRTALVVVATALLALFGSTAAASASPDTTGNTTTVTIHGVTVTATSTNGVKPNIIGGSCVGRDEWLHLYTSTGSLCFGYTGSLDINANDTHAVCWGNNYGSLKYSSLPNGDIDVWEVTINGWSGYATCPVNG